MAAKISYLRQSSSGWYEYRRKTPKRLSEFFPEGKRVEWKQALETKDMTTAQRRWADENTKFENAKALAEKLAEKPDELLSYEVLEVANRIVRDAGLHPEQAPAIKPKGDVKQLLEEVETRDEQFDLLLEIVDDNSIDEEQMAKDYSNGQFFSPDYKLPRKNNPRDPYRVAYDIATGDIKTSLQPTWRDAVETYIRVNKADKKREAVKEQRWEKKTRSLYERFASAMGGMDTKLDDLDRHKIRNWLWSNFKVGSRNRYNNQLSAVINTWNRETPKKVHNPFTGLSNKKLEQEEASNRRSLKPAEWFKYHDEIQKIEDIQLKIISLLMMYTGCRPSEAAGLQVKDLKINTNMPHVVYSTNPIRRMDKDGLERAVPLLTPVLNTLRQYKLPTDPDAAAFPKYGSTNGFDAVSMKTRSVLRTKAEINDPSVTPYSARHTFKDRSAKAQIPREIAEYIMGHVGKDSSKIHDKYGTATPPEVIFKYMEQVYSTADWGYYRD